MIGVFDSGYGGLTILRALVDTLPQYSYIYFGDNARAPYGDRKADEIYDFTRQGVDYLFQQGSEIVILACNTASAVALRRLQREWLPAHYPNRRILGILVPTIEQITGVGWQTTKPLMSAPLGQATIGVLATEQTVRSKAYETEIHKRNPSLRVIQQACPGLVAAIENDEAPAVIGSLIDDYGGQLIKTSNAQQNTLTAILLGCTHFELIKDLIRAALPTSVRVFEQPRIVAKSLTRYLDRHSEITSRLKTDATRTFITSGDTEEVSLTASRYYREPVKFAAMVL